MDLNSSSNLNLDDLQRQQQQQHTIQMEGGSLRAPIGAGHESEEDGDEEGNNNQINSYSNGNSDGNSNVSSNDCDADGEEEEEENDDDEAFVASCTDASFVLNPHNSNLSRRLYINKLYQPMNGGSQLSLVEEQDDELLLYQELESLESSLLKSANGRRRRGLTKILEGDDDDDDDDDEIYFDDEDEDETNLKRDDFDEDSHQNEAARNALNGGNFIGRDHDHDHDQEAQVRQTHSMLAHSSSDKLQLESALIDAFGSNFPPSPLSECPPQAEDHHEINMHHQQHQQTTTTTAGDQQLVIIDSSATAIDHRHGHNQYQQLEDSRQLLECETSYETPPISTYSESVCAAELMTSLSRSPSGSHISELTNCEPAAAAAAATGAVAGEGTVGSGAAVGDSSKYRRRTANARERVRMREINQAFEKLKRVVPAELVQQHHLQQLANGSNNADGGSSVASMDDDWSAHSDGHSSRAGRKSGQQQQSAKLTKITTLRLAKSYITILTDLLKEPSSSSSPPIGLGDNETSCGNKHQPAQQVADSSTAQPTAIVKIPPSNLFNGKRKSNNNNNNPKRRAYKRRQPSADPKSTCQQQQQQAKRRSQEQSATGKQTIISSSVAPDESHFVAGKLGAESGIDSRQQQQIVSSTTTTCNALAVSRQNSIQIPITVPVPVPVTVPIQLPAQSQHQTQTIHQLGGTYQSYAEPGQMGTIQLQQQPQQQQQPARHHPILIAAANNMLGRCLLSTNNGYISLAPQNQTSQTLRHFVTPVAVAFFGLPATATTAAASATTTHSLTSAPQAANCGWISQPALTQQPQFITAGPQPVQLQQLQLHQPRAATTATTLSSLSSPTQSQSLALAPVPLSAPTQTQAPAQVPAKQVAAKQPAVRTYRFHNYDGKSLYANNQDNKHNQQPQTTN